MGACLRIVLNGPEAPAQFYGGGELSVLLESSAYGGRILFADDEHEWEHRVVARPVASPEIGGLEWAPFASW